MLLNDFFLSFSPKMFKQIVHPIYLTLQLNVLYRIVSKKFAQYTALLNTALLTTNGIY